MAHPSICMVCAQPYQQRYLRVHEPVDPLTLTLTLTRYLRVHEPVTR